MTRRVGILGGTFDPIHAGHLDLAAAAERTLSLTSLLLMPAHVPPHRPLPSASSFHRFAMIALAIADRNGWSASDMELLESERSYSSATLARLQARGYAAAELFFLIGADAFRDIESWHDYPAILDRANFAVVTRPAFPVSVLPSLLPTLAPRMRMPDAPEAGTTTIILIDAPTSDVSATAIRQHLAEGSSIDGLVPASVAQHIARHGLYAAAASDRRSSGVH